MNRITMPRARLWTRLRVDAAGEFIDSPSWLLPVWIVLLLLLALEALNESGWIGGPSVLYQRWIHDSVLAAAAVLTFIRAAHAPVARRAWLFFGLAMAVWCAGDVSWSIVYGGQTNPPYPTFADVLWLLWYPLMVIAMLFLIRVRFRNFDVLRWMDGVAVTLMVLVAGFGLLVQPLAEHSSKGWLAAVVSFSYPVLDVLLIGVLLGIYGLMGWKPNRMWVFIGLGILVSTGADAAFAVQEARGIAQGDNYDFVWTIGALLIAYAAWVRVPTKHDDDVPVTGMRAVALALIAQALAISIQITAIFHEIGRSERVVTAIVLVVASIQIIVTRPRARAGAAEAEAEAESAVASDQVTSARETDGKPVSASDPS